LFGNFRPINTRYLRSLQVKLAGGNKLEVARTFYDIYVRDLGINDKVGLSKAREFSADRVMRLYRFRGQNSQPLDYIEQELIGRAITNLPEAQQSALLNISNGYSLKDAVKLHQAGLLQRPNKKIIEGADITWQIFTHDFLPQL
jgi:hypothetical protein